MSTDDKRCSKTKDAKRNERNEPEIENGGKSVGQKYRRVKQKPQVASPVNRQQQENTNIH